MTDKKSILVVEDEDALRDVLRLELEKIGYKVDDADDGDVAITAIQKKHYDLVLLDILMPRVNGLDVLSFIQNQSPSTKVIMLTAMADIQHAMEAKQRGATDFLTKPYNYDDVITRVSTLLQ